MIDPAIVIGVDPSLTAAGVATAMTPECAAWGGDDQFSVATFGRAGKNDEPLNTRLERIELLADEIRDQAVNLMQWPSLMLIETPAYSQSTGKTHDRSGLWWEVVRIFRRELEIPVIEVSVQKVKTYATGKGNTAKQAVLLEVARRHPHVAISNDNEADAFTLAAIGMRLIGAPIDDVPKTHLRAMEGLEFP
ncbi:RuvC-like resolvase [Microbacterium phage Blab]|nr:RuvC-like resolvase [Microbacterium phage Blab]